MTELSDYKRCVEAPAIRSYEATIRSLRQDLQEMTEAHHYEETLRAAQAARISALEKALEPFARVGGNIVPGLDPEQSVMISTERGSFDLPEGAERARLILSLDGTSLADFRTARALLNPTPTEER